jgi:DNA-binding NarL/FixJ family response regulator
VPRSAADGLSTPEDEVARLLSEGLTNRQIAQRLVIASGAVQRHVANILAKLGFGSRAQIAVWAMSIPPTGQRARVRR